MASTTNKQHPQEATQTQAFPLPKLPPELRRLIWSHTLPGPRIHKAVYRRYCGRSTAAETHILSPRPPIALSICKESRDVALEVFKTFAPCQCPGVGQVRFFNPQADILYIDINSPCEEWFAPWCDFSRVSVAVQNNEQDYENLSSMLLLRPIISHVYLTVLEMDEKMMDIFKSKRSRRRHIKYPEILIRATKCVPIQELEVVDGEESQYEELRSMASSLLSSEKHKHLSIDVALARGNGEFSTGLKVVYRTPMKYKDQVFQEINCA
ncbi:hypothetical protein FPSE_00269 [Fusarium pseudograminearum CS3096]|uniref:2EXR domain-containing protein n=1 Tax=Fusarium pseudograminearum (strain CS3096) TaxID=1028729 RepID=K3VV56_FUSPC|nr:hypothetical protein FPSE_00269 [Fusarium pseudograminearum CS3096]EKJ79584.1 hypothetical protein FPSE_00269 [Fusarium pseudograminearum CS3096]